MYRIVNPHREHQQFRRSIQLAAIDKQLPQREINDVCRQLGYAWRTRQLPPDVLVRSMVYRHLNPDRSIAAVLADMAAVSKPGNTAPSDSAWCQARSHLPETVLVELIFRKARACRRRFSRQHLRFGRPVFIVDGSTVSMPDEPELVEAFGYANTKHGFSRFPVARITFIELAGLEIIWDYRLRHHRCDEDRQFHEMWDVLPDGCICLFDRWFSSFYNIAKLRQRRIGVVTRLHQRRIPQRLINSGRALGPNEWLVPFELAPQIRQRYDDPTLPQKLWVRLIRVQFMRGGKRRTVWVVTTLIDPVKYPRRQIAELYRSRWGIEPRIGSLKTTLQMDVLRSKSSGAIRHEVAATILGHNLVWMLIHEAAEQTGTPSQTISFAGAVKTILAFSTALAAADKSEREDMRHAMLDRIASQRNHHPPGRAEPRLVKRDRRRFGSLKISRAQARIDCLT
jgi:hypothetical protein